jgi:hypothetical protein
VPTSYTPKFSFYSVEELVEVSINEFSGPPKLLQYALSMAGNFSLLKLEHLIGISSFPKGWSA